MLDLIFLATTGALLLSTCLCILGNFVVWQRISYIGDSIAHSSLLGLILAELLHTSVNIITIIICFIFSILFVNLNKKFKITKDSLLIFNTQFSLSLGFILLSIFSSGRLLNNYFFGSILSIDINDIYIIFVILIFIILLTYIYWEKLLLITLNNTIANAEGINTKIFNIVFIFFLSLVIAFSIKFIGILLVPSLLILPALASLNIFNSPLKSILFSIVLSANAILLGIWLSSIINIQPSPLISFILIIAIILKVFITYIYNKIKLFSPSSRR
jgi:zinc transport system permease protein